VSSIQAATEVDCGERSSTMAEKCSSSSPITSLRITHFRSSLSKPELKQNYNLGKCDICNSFYFTTSNHTGTGPAIKGRSKKKSFKWDLLSVHGHKVQRLPVSLRPPGERPQYS
jgi:hypothetical protein